MNEPNDHDLPEEQMAEIIAAQNQAGMMLIQDEEAWLRRYGLAGEPQFGDASYLNQQEAKERIEQLKEYQTNIHQTIFETDATIQQELKAFQAQQLMRQQLLESLEKETIAILIHVIVQNDNNNNNNDNNNFTNNNDSNDDNDDEKWEEENPTTTTTTTIKETIHFNLKALATYSDTVYTMASSRPHFETATNDEEKSNTTTNNNNNSKLTLTLSLQEYDADAVRAILAWIERIDTVLKDEDKAIVRTGAGMNNGKNKNGNNNNSINNNEVANDDKVRKRQRRAKIMDCFQMQELYGGEPPHYIIDMCRIAHYLQCSELLDALVQEILLEAVDSHNCLSLCQLADQLHLPDLLEASINHMMKSLDKIQNHPIWDDFSKDFQQQILSIQSILTSNQRQQLYFHSFHEYIAMMAEQVDYYQERLIQAQRQQDSLLMQHQRRNTNSNNSSNNIMDDPSWQYAQEKIEKQKERVQILKITLKEQKKMFRDRPDFFQA